MTNGKSLTTTLVVLVVLLVTVAGTMAQASAPEGVTETQATVDTTFTFQGHLEDGGAPPSPTPVTSSSSCTMPPLAVRRSALL